MEHTQRVRGTETKEKQDPPTCYLGNMGGTLSIKNIVLSMFRFLKGCFVLFNRSGTQMGVLGGGVRGQLVGVSGQVDERHAVYLCLCQRALLMSCGTQTQINKRRHSADMSRHGKTVCCMSALMHCSVLPSSPPHPPPHPHPSPCYITHPRFHCNILFIHTHSAHTPVNNGLTDRHTQPTRFLQTEADVLYCTVRNICTWFKTSSEF